MNGPGKYPDVLIHGDRPDQDILSATHTPADPIGKTSFIDTTRFC
jgi:hypothetical protein